MNTAIIVAAGNGQRFSAHTSKQFVEILGKPLIIHTLDRFESCPAIDSIILVLSAAGREEFATIRDRYRLTKLRDIALGGNSRAESVLNGLNAVDPLTANVVAIHDGARPLVSVDEITRTVDKAFHLGAACLIADLTDTIKEINGDFISGTIDRGRLRRALTPQAFRYDLLRRAFDGMELDESITDECYLVEKLGVKIAHVAGSSTNIKITRPEDLIFFQAILSEPSP